MKCTELKAIVEKSWQFLFTEFGFEILNCQEGSRESVLLCAESSDARVRFMSTNYDDELDIDFGPLTAPLDWSPNSDVTTNEHPQWYSLRGLLIYLENDSFKVEDLLKNVKDTYANKGAPSSQPPQLELLARRAKPFMQKILSFFAERNFEAFRAEYDQFNRQQHDEFEHQWDVLRKKNI